MQKNKKIILKKKDVVLERASGSDESGFIFYRQGRVFRAVAQDDTFGLYKDLLSSKIAQELFGGGLVRTWIPEDVEFEDVAGLLEHKKIDFLSCSAEWTAKMLWDAAHKYAVCQKILLKKELMFKDCHTWNILFDYCDPVIIDFGAIVRITSSSTWINGMHRWFVIPLWIHKYCGKTGKKIARELMREHMRGLGCLIGSMRFMRYFPLRFYFLRKRYEQAAKKKNKAAMHRILKKIEKYINKLAPKASKEYWANYPNKLSEKQEIIKDVLKNINSKYKTVLDMGANKGQYAFLAEALGYKVIAFDYEEYCVDQIYEVGKHKGSRVLPLVMDFSHPTPESGIGLASPNSYERYISDITLVLGLVHHLSLRQKIGFNAISRIISNYTREVSVVEFVPKTDECVQTWNIPEVYSKENFIESMNNCGLLLTQDKHMQQGRHILVFKRDI